jgi:hypothetical protein
MMNHRVSISAFGRGAAALPVASRIAGALSGAAGADRRPIAAGGSDDIVARRMVGGCPSVSASNSLSRTGPVRRHYRHGGGRESARRRLLASWSLRRRNRATLYDKLTYNFIRDIAPVAAISRKLNMLVNPSVPARTVPESSPTQGNPARSAWHRRHGYHLFDRRAV